MKYIYLLTLSSLFFFNGFAATKKLIVNNGDFAAANSWMPSALPADGDVLIVPKDYSLKVEGVINLSTSKLTIIIDGTVDLTNGKVYLGSESIVYLSSTTAKIVSLKGNPADKISIGGDEKYNGNVGTLAGPAIADVSTATTSTATSGFVAPSTTTVALMQTIASSGNSVLPVKFLSFNVSKASTGVYVQWSTAQEINANVFQIERSEDSRTWKTVGTVKAAGNSSYVQNYSFNDKTILNKVAYYRIKEVDMDGQFAYTEVKNVTNQSNLPSTDNNVTIYASGNNVMVNFSKQVTGIVVVRLISFGGQVMAQHAYNQVSQQIIFNKTFANKGNYIVSVTNNSDLNVSRQVAL